MRKEVLLFLFILFIINISALCENNQININEASINDLDKLTGIGPSKAQSIIDSRPFNSVDDLLKVSGIGEITLEKIKTQGLACVSEEKNNANEEESIKKDEEESIEEESDKEEVKEEKEVEEIIEVVEIKQEKIDNIQKELIVLTSLDTKDIKSEKDKEKSEKNNYAIYGLVGFGIIILFLSIIKNYKLVRKNEFR